MSQSITIRAISAGIVLAITGQALASMTLYRETFPTDPNATRKERVQNNGWFGEQHGSVWNPANAADQDLQISESAGSSELGNVGNVPSGGANPTSFAFYSPSNRAGIYIGTFEFSMPIADLEEVRWESRSSAGPRGDNDDSAAPNHPAGSSTESDQHLFLNVDGVTYISQTGVFIEDPDTWNTISFDPTVQLYNRYDALNVGEPIVGDPNFALQRFSGDAADTGLSWNDILAAGTTLDGVGLYIQKNLNGADEKATIRIDNFELLGVPSPGAAALLTCAGLVGMRRRRA
jgi:hypothetical protein